MRASRASSSGSGDGTVEDSDSPAGNSTQKVEPVPTSLRTPIEPAWASTSVRVSERPTPVPSAPRRSNGVKTSSSRSAGMPCPVSVTVSRSSVWPGEGSAQRTSMTPPSRLYFTAFDSRFTSTCLKR